MIFRAVVHGAVGMLAMSAAAQIAVASDQPVSVTEPPTEPTMMRIVPYPDELQALLGYAPASCYRIGRCSAYDLYRFRDSRAASSGGASGASLVSLFGRSLKR